MTSKKQLIEDALQDLFEQAPDMFEHASTDALAMAVAYMNDDIGRTNDDLLISCINEWRTKRGLHTC